MDGWSSASEARRRVSVDLTDSRLRRLANEGKVRTAKVGRRRLYCLRDLERVVAEWMADGGVLEEGW